MYHNGSLENSLISDEASLQVRIEIFLIDKRIIDWFGFVEIEGEVVNIGIAVISGVTSGLINEYLCDGLQVSYFLIWQLSWL